MKQTAPPAPSDFDDGVDKLFEHLSNHSRLYNQPAAQFFRFIYEQNPQAAYDFMRRLTSEGEQTRLTDAERTYAQRFVKDGRKPRPASDDVAIADRLEAMREDPPRLSRRQFGLGAASAVVVGGSVGIFGKNSQRAEHPLPNVPRTRPYTDLGAGLGSGALTGLVFLSEAANYNRRIHMAQKCAHIDAILQAVNNCLHANLGSAMGLQQPVAR